MLDIFYMWLADSSHWLAHYGWQGFAAATHIVQWPDGRQTGGSATQKSGAGSLWLLLSEQGWAWFLSPDHGGFGVATIFASSVIGPVGVVVPLVWLYPATAEVATQFEVAADAMARAGGAGLVALLARAMASATLKFSYVAGHAQRGGLAMELAWLASLALAQQRAEQEALPPELRWYLSLEQATT
jgi:hypothetical protein